MVKVKVDALQVAQERGGKAGVRCKPEGPRALGKVKPEWGGGSTGGKKLLDSISLQELRQMREDGLNNTEIGRLLDVGPQVIGRYLGPNPLGTAEMRALRREREKEHPGRLAGFVPYERKRPERDKPEEAKPKPCDVVTGVLLRQIQMVEITLQSIKAGTLEATADGMAALMMAAVETARELRIWEEVKRWDTSGVKR